MNLILRQFDPQSGQILIDGVDIRDMTQDALHSQISLIPQDPSLFHRTLIENIRYGRLDASDEEVVEAARQPMLTILSRRLRKGMILWLVSAVSNFLEGKDKGLRSRE